MLLFSIDWKNAQLTARFDEVLGDSFDSNDWLNRKASSNF